ncbi:MAG: bifunctional UDP-sugar hydrolase/5'-nucleotidase [Chlamydiota bacterium]
MNARLRRLLLLVLALCAGCRGIGPAGNASLCILHTSDVHGHIVPERVAGWNERLGGSAVLAGCVNAIREDNNRKSVPTLLLDAGDFYLGTPEGDISKGSALIELMNVVGYDALAVGNHDWDGGVSNLMALAERADFPFLAANVINPETGAPPGFLHAHIIKKCGPLRVGVIGITLEDSTPQELPGGKGRIVCAAPEEYVRESLEELRHAGVNCTILVSHLGLLADKKIAREVDGLDVILGGHNHVILKSPFRSSDSGTLICHAGSYGKYLGKLDLATSPRTGRAGKYRYELIPLVEGRCPPDAAAGAVVDKWRSVTGKRFDEVIGYSESDFFKDREGVAMLGEMIADGMREATGAPISFNQRHGIRGPLLKGTIRYRDAYTILPFDDTLWTVALTGAQIREILEKVLSFRRPDNLRFSGLTVEYDPASPGGRKIVTVKCGGSDMRDDETYRVAVNTYLVKWGFINTLVAKGRDLVDTRIIARDMLRDYFRAHSPLSEKAFHTPRLVAIEKVAATGTKTPGLAARTEAPERDE